MQDKATVYLADKIDMTPHVRVSGKTARVMALTSGNEQDCHQVVVEGSEQDDERLASCYDESAQRRGGKRSMYRKEQTQCLWGSGGGVTEWEWWGWIKARRGSKG